MSPTSLLFIFFVNYGYLLFRFFPVAAGGRRAAAAAAPGVRRSFLLRFAQQPPKETAAQQLNNKINEIEETEPTEGPGEPWIDPLPPAYEYPAEDYLVVPNSRRYCEGSSILKATSAASVGGRFCANETLLGPPGPRKSAHEPPSSAGDPGRSSSKKNLLKRPQMHFLLLGAPPRAAAALARHLRPRAAARDGGQVVSLF